MNNQQLNSLVVLYQNSKKDEYFMKIFSEVETRWRQENVINLLANRYNLDRDEVESIANLELYKALSQYKPIGSFYNFLSKAISRECIDESRRKRRMYEREVSLDKINTDDENDKTAILDFFIGGNVEDEAIGEIIKKDDQRQLIAHLLDEASEKSRQALEAFVSADYSYTKAAKLLGVKYDTVKRRINKIASHYDANHNGDIYDYFSDATAI